MAPARRWLLVSLAVSAMATAVHAQEINWQEAVARLARERTLAETCAGLLKKHGDKATQARLEWSLRSFDASGALVWRRAAPGRVWAVNITGDGRLVVAAYGDGTIRWHRMSDGVELLAFMPLPDKINWVAWTPDGFYAATPGAHGILRWHINHGWDAPAESIPVEDIPGSFRPAVLPLVLQELETHVHLGSRYSPSTTRRWRSAPAANYRPASNFIC
jgi:hypothetical protein